VTTSGLGRALRTPSGFLSLLTVTPRQSEVTRSQTGDHPPEEKHIMRNLKRNAAITGAAAILAALGIGGAVTAQATTNDPAPIVQQSDGDGEVDDATEVEGAEEANDGPDQGPDANPNEPGHQDADETGETE